MSPKVSIIVPVYKAEAYLHRCIDSLLNQTFQDYEILLIDDGSPDCSGEICDEYAEKDNRIRVFHKENGGVSSARNLGINNSRGEWICFVDSDDWLDSNYIINFINLIIANNLCEIAIQGFIRVDELNSKEINKVVFPKISFKSNYELIKYIEETPNVHNGYLWHKCFKKDIIDRYNISFKEGLSFAEDGLFIYEYLKYTKNSYFSSQVGYYHGIRPNTLTTLKPIYSFDVFKDLIESVILLLTNYDVSVNCKEYYMSFVRKYLLRLTKEWFILNAVHRSESDRILFLNYSRDLVLRYELSKIMNLSLIDRFLLRNITQKNFRVVVVTLQIIIKAKTFRKNG